MASIVVIVAGALALLSMPLSVLVFMALQLHPLLSRLDTLRMIKYLAVINIFSTVQYPMALTDIFVDSPLLCKMQAASTEFFFLSWIGIHTTIGIEVYHQVNTANGRLFFIKEWMTVFGIFVSALVATALMLLPCVDTIVPFNHSTILRVSVCFMRHSVCRYILFDFPIVLAFAINAYILLCSLRLVRTEQLTLNAILLRYIIFYCLAFAAVFVLYLLDELLLLGGLPRLPFALSCLAYLLLASHGLINAGVFFIVWRNIRTVLGGHRTLPPSLGLGDLRRLQEWEFLMKNLTGRVRPRLASAAVRIASGNFAASPDVSMRPHSRTINSYVSAATGGASAVSSAGPSLASDAAVAAAAAAAVSFELIYPDLFAAHREADRLNARLGIDEWRTVFFFEQLQVSEADTVPFLGPRVSERQGPLVLVRAQSAWSACNPWRSRMRERYLFRLVGDKLHYYLTQAGVESETTPLVLLGLSADEKNFAGTIPLAGLVSVTPLDDPRVRGASGAANGYAFAIRACVEKNVKGWNAAPLLSAELASAVGLDLGDEDLPEIHETVWMLEAATARERADWMDAIRNHREAGLSHVEENEASGKPVLAIGSTSLSITRHVLLATSAPAWLADSREFLAALCTVLQTRPSFLLNIYDVYKVGAIGYVVSESTWALLGQLVDENELDAAMEEFFFCPSHGWGETGLGFSTRMRVLARASVLAQLERDVALLASYSLVGYSLQISCAQVIGWAVKTPVERESIVARMTAAHVLVDPEVGRLFLVRLMDFLPGCVSVGAASGALPSRLRRLVCGRRSPAAAAAAYASSFLDAVRQHVLVAADSAARPSALGAHGLSPHEASSIFSSMRRRDASSQARTTRSSASSAQRRSARLTGAASRAINSNSPLLVPSRGAYASPSSDPPEPAPRATVVSSSVYLSSSVRSLLHPMRAELCGKRIARWVTLFAALAITMGTASLYLISYLLASFNREFHMDQSRRVSVYIIGNLGLWLGGPLGHVVERLGPRLTVLLAGCVFAISYGVLLLMQLRVIAALYPLFCLVIFLIGLTSFLLSTAAMWVVLVLFQFSWAPVLMGCSAAVTSLGAQLISFVLFYTGMRNLTIALTCYGLGFCLLSLAMPSDFDHELQAEAQWQRSKAIARARVRSTSSTRSTGMLAANAAESLMEATADMGARSQQSTSLFALSQRLSLGSLARSPEFQLLFVVMLCTKGFADMVITFIPEIERAMNRQSDARLAFFLFGVGHICGALFYGNLVQLFPRLHFSYTLFCVSVALSLADLILTYWSVEVMEGTIMTIGVLYGILDAAMPLAVVDCFSVDHFPQIYSYLSTAQVVGALLGSSIAIYELLHEADPCIGANCFRVAMVSGSLAALVAVFAAIQLWRRAQLFASQVRRRKLIVSSAASAAHEAANAGVNAVVRAIEDGPNVLEFQASRFGDWDE